MGLFTVHRTAEYEKVAQAIKELQQLGMREGTEAAVDGSWKLMRRCFCKMAQGRAWYAPMTLHASRVSFGMHADVGQWFFAACSSLSYSAAVAMMEAQCSKQGAPFPEEFFADMQMMAEMSVDVAHRAGVPLVGYLVAEALTGLQMGDRTIARETSDLLGGDDAVQPLRALRRSVREALRQARSAPSNAAGVDTVAALRVMADEMLVRDLDATLDRFSKGHILSGSNTVSAILAASKTSRTVVYVAPGTTSGAAIRMDAPESGRDLCTSVSLPGLRVEAVRNHLQKMHAVLSSDEPRKRVRDRAVRDAHAAVGDAIWKPLLAAWPDLLGARIALVPLGESARLPLYTAPVDETGTPVCGLMDLTVAPSGNALMFAGAWPRPSRIDPLVVADPWFDDGAGAGPIPFTVPEAREVAAVHGVKPVIFREEAKAVATGDDGERLRGLTGPRGSAALPEAGASSRGLSELMASANLIHLAGHGFLDPHHPLDSSVLLGRPLPLSALLDHDLRRGTTVVLSACHLAGIGTRLPGEQLGFPAAMLAMGASSVVAALWSVPDAEEVVRLMATFHKLVRGTSPSAALGQAVSRAAAEGTRPTMWGPFTHFGA
ncbi:MULTISPECIES: CHAT domain-containing protein [unclassified Streptomyces]|uniref:CHAT domain-containing protein n=1 Tax=unclassified Streptomyces TaxID=2593676 RepID=UPI002DD7C46A|nr:CHAT domain-containing protein [Streptomyces sp. NBC_01788]WSB25439.1 CHAT domain-containing protein [Streptomyces sp. NBC_01788]